MPLGNVQNLKENVRYCVRSEVTSVEQMILTRVYLPISSGFVPFPHPNSFQTLRNRALVLGKKHGQKSLSAMAIISTGPLGCLTPEEPTHSKHPKKRLNLLSVRDAKGSVTWCRKRSKPLGPTRHWIPVESTVGSLAGDRFRRKPRRTPRAKFEMLQICCFFLHNSPTLGLVA